MQSLVNTTPFENESELIQTLYGSLTHKEGFHPFLAMLAETVQASVGALACYRRSPIAAEYFWYAGPDLPDNFMEELMANNMLERDAVINLAVRQMPHGIQTASQAVEAMKIIDNPERWEENDRQIKKVMGMRDAAWMVVHGSDEFVLLLTMVRMVGRPNYEPHELAPINRLVPHIRQTFQMYKEVNKSLVDASSLASVLDAIPKPSIILSDLSEVLHCNRSAKTLMAESSCISLSENRLVFSKTAEKNEFAKELIEIMRSSMGLVPFCSASLYIKRDNKPDLIVCLSPIENIDQNRGGALVTLFDPESRDLPSAKKIANYFSLTPAEGKLCEDLVRGLSLKKIAENRHKSEATLRSYLKQIFEKTGFNRQGQLVSSILSALIE
jgi:DNA-binding CsgD family transcriptional regulator